MSGATGSTLQGLLARAAGFPAAGLRLVDGAERERFLSWGELRRRAVGVAGRLVAAGVAPGERVALIYPTGAAFFDAFFGVLLAGAVPVPLYPPVRLGRLAEYRERTAALVAAAGAVLVLVDSRLGGLAGEAIERAAPRLGGRTIEQLPPEPADADERVRLGAPDDLALVQFSSGTTVEPKPVALSQRAVLAQVAALNALWPDTPDRVHSGVSWLPLYHDMGLIGCIFPALERPSVMTLLPPERFVGRPALWLRALARHRATISVAPNFAYALAAERVRDAELAGCDLSHWRIALCGAETVSAATLRAFAQRFARFGFDPAALTPVYGLSEAALAVTAAPLARPFGARRLDRLCLATDGAAVDDPAGVEVVSVGRPLPGFALELRDPEGRALPEGRVGRLFVRGPSLMDGYLERPTESAAVLSDGWLDTGDLGFVADGELYLTGRARDLLILRGRNHAPSDVEAAADGVEGVRRGCTAAVSHRAEGEATDRLLLFVERQRGLAAGPEADGPLAERVRAAVLAATSLAVDELVVLPPGALPRTSSGKIRRAEALRRHLSGQLEAAPASRLAVVAALWRGRRALRRSRVAP